MVKVDLTGTSAFFDPAELDFAAAAAAHRMLGDKSGVGSEFTGWLELPERIRDGELKAILSAAQRIRSRSKALVVIGIGGSYLGARGAIELLRPIREEAERILADKAYLESVYRTGAQKASYLAEKTLRKVYKKVGFVAR